MSSTWTPDLRAFYEFNSMHTEAWDGPAGLVHHRRPLCRLRPGPQRPAALALGADQGRYPHRGLGGRRVTVMMPDEVVAKGRLGPGQILVHRHRNRRAAPHPARSTRP